MWHFTEIDNDSRILTDPTKLTVQSHGDLSQLQIFVREVLQNSLDNRSGQAPVRVDFRLRYVGGVAKEQFLQNIHFEQIRPHLQAVIKSQKNKKMPLDLPDPATIDNKNYPLKLLYIEDFGTRGLIGPEHSRETSRFPPPHCFLGLCRNIGDSQKGSETLGGTYGLGKTVLWKNSRLSLVMFYSCLATPYISQTGREHWKRFFGHIRLTGHDIANQAYKGEGFWGDRLGDATLSILDEQADGAAEQLGMIVRRKNQPGTSILVVDFDDPDTDDEEEDIDTIERICESAELYYWPAMADGRLRVRVRAESERPDAWKIAPQEDRPELVPFVVAYAAARLNKVQGSINLKTHDVMIPKDPGEGEKEIDSKIVICTNLKSEETDAPSKYLNRTALIRGAGMVIGYQKIGRPGFGGSDFWAVVLGGKSCPDYLSLSEQQRERCEQLIASSEPVTHDVWTPNSEALRKWRGARAQIVKMIDGIKQAITSATTVETKPEGRAISLLASMFPLSEGSGADGSRDMHLEVVQQPTLMESDNGQLRYEFQIRILIPGRDAFAEIVKPLRWRVECQYGFYGEDVHRKVIENVDLEFTHVSKNGSGWKALSSRENWYEDFVEDQEISCELKGETKSMESFLALITKHELQVKVLKSY